VSEIMSVDLRDLLFQGPVDFPIAAFSLFAISNN